MNCLVTILSCKFKRRCSKGENPEFERYFVVYGDDQIESRYVLSTSLVQRILDFRKKTGRRVYLSFVGSQVFVAIPYRRSLFEPRVFASIVGFKGVREYFDDLKLALGIVEDLNLNTRIWSRQHVMQGFPAIGKGLLIWSPTTRNAGFPPD